MQLIKRLTQTLSAGSTSLTFTDSLINDNSIIEVYADSIEVYPTALSQTGTSVTVQFDAQTAAHSILLLINNIVSLSDPELATLLDVDLSTLSEDDILTYDETADKWVNAGARTAEDITYDNTDSGLTATDVQSAIDELAQPKAASNISYDNTDSGLEAENVQDAIDELTSYTSLLTTSPTVWVNSSTEITLNEDLTDYSRITINGYLDTDAGGRRFSISCDLNALRLSNGFFSIGVIASTLLRVPIAVNAWCRLEKLRLEFLDVSTILSISNTVYIKSVLGYK